jgi:hypothetical protein
LAPHPVGHKERDVIDIETPLPFPTVMALQHGWVAGVVNMRAATLDGGGWGSHLERPWLRMTAQIHPSNPTRQQS